ncbi:MAG: peptide-methionine (S)-S-oxide reductase MsrA [Actinomycetaceae bacterium]|nr:peptide-methionine (S)-S-oxide reductase MsrA [Actinomycetaceae bacterium]MDU0970701.1 peptide-methionine (S)-S-oxide reductase MsrA [Actinomycetaceae bacterium]
MPQTDYGLVGPHVVLPHSITEPVPDSMRVIDLAMGCFWGAERLMWSLPGIWTTAVGYEGGDAEYPSYREVCGGRTGHAETVRVVFDPAQTGLADILRAFFDNHDPTQGMRQGNDVGEQYRSVIFPSSTKDLEVACAIRDAYGEALAAQGFGPVTTEVAPVDPTRMFWLAEDYHQQYLAKNPDGYCGLGGTGVSCPMPPARR